VRAREGAQRALGKPRYATSALLGALFGAAIAATSLLERLLPSLMPITSRPAQSEVLHFVVQCAFGALLGVCVAALVRAARWAVFRARY
jgi:hypothetical protein